MNNNWIYTGERNPGKEPGWFEVKDSGDETLRLYWGGIWFLNSWFLDDKCKEKYRYHISYWRPIQSASGYDSLDEITLMQG